MATAASPTPAKPSSIFTPRSTTAPTCAATCRGKTVVTAPMVLGRGGWGSRCHAGSQDAIRFHARGALRPPVTLEQGARSHRVLLDHQGAVHHRGTAPTAARSCPPHPQGVEDTVSV